MVSLIHDRPTVWLFGGVLAVLLITTIAGLILKRPALNARIRVWWVMAAVFAISLLTGRIGSVVLFAFLSFFALREFITLTPTRPADHSALFWVFFIITPLQYYLIADDWYGFFTVLIPVYAFLFIPSRIAMSGDPQAFLERSAKIQWGLMICVYCLSHVPALLILQIPHFNGNARLLMFLVVVVQISDVLQDAFGVIAGIVGATALGTALWWATPFTLLQTAGMALVITVMGFLGRLSMSAIKRDRGVKDFGSTIEGHGGVLDRIDSLCFAGPIFFHLTRYFFA